MHELLLHGTVPTTRHSQVLSILAGIAAMQPQPFHERRLIYKPTRPIARPSVQVGGSQAVQSKQANPMQTVQGAIQGDLFYLHLAEDLVTESNGKGDMERKGGGVEVGEEEMMDSGDGEDGVSIFFFRIHGLFFLYHLFCLANVSHVFLHKTTPFFLHTQNQNQLTTHPDSNSPPQPPSQPNPPPPKP